MVLTKDEVQQKIELTDKQKKAWTQLVRAVNRCSKEKIFLYQVLENLGGLNGHNVISVENIENTEHTYDSGHNLQNLLYPTVTTDCGWADDTHVVILKTGTIHEESKDAK
jgi:HD-like signal output (HDOD) protein